MQDEGKKRGKKGKWLQGKWKKEHVGPSTESAWTAGSLPLPPPTFTFQQPHTTGPAPPTQFLFPCSPGQPSTLQPDVTRSPRGIGRHVLLPSRTLRGLSRSLSLSLSLSLSPALLTERAPASRPTSPPAV
jgi:hypothetical protein